MAHLQYYNCDLTSDQLNTLLRDNADNNIVIRLNVWKNRIEYIPETVLTLIHLTMLDFESNQLRVLPDAIGRLVHLQWLFLNKNYLELLPFTIGKCSKLEVLGVCNNNLTRLPYILSSLKLRILDVTNNSALPSEIAEAAYHRPEIVVKLQQRILHRYRPRGAREAAKTLMLIKKFSRDSIWDRVPLDLVRYVFPPLLIATENDEEWHAADDVAFNLIK